MADFTIYDLAAGGGQLGICQMPGKNGEYLRDVAAIAAWQPDLVMSATGADERAQFGARSLGDDLQAKGIDWIALPIADFGVPDTQAQAIWDDIEPKALAILGRGGRVLAHCRGGCGRSGMLLMRLIVMAGEDADAALSRLRAARLCAVETKAQLAWASTPLRGS